MTLPTKRAETDEVEILKTDTLGRVWTPRAKREALVAEYERSSMSAAEFAKWSGVKYATFAGWVAKVRMAGQGAVEEKWAAERGLLRWADTVVEEGTAGSAASLAIYLGSAVRVKARDRQVAANCCQLWE